MSDEVDLKEKPSADVIYMLAGWRQWADAGSVSSGLPEYLIKQTKARLIGKIRPDGFYLFQIPGTHGLVRPVVHFEQGYPQSLGMQRNEFFYTGDRQRGLVIFLGDEPHMDVERYVEMFLGAVKMLGVKRVIGFGGVYGELPYDKDRMVSCIYSLHSLKDELGNLAVTLSDYHGGASIGSFICRHAGEQGLEYVGMYSFVPTYDFSGAEQIGSAIRIENDFMAWLGVMRRVNSMLHTDYDLTDLEKRSQELIRVVDEKMDELDKAAPQLGVRDYLKRLSDDFVETPFEPLDDIWEDEIRRLFDKYEGDDQQTG
jgi:proteasome assembly chaperone (PAC2) family protein